MRADHDHVDPFVTSIADYLVGRSSCEKRGLEDEASAKPPCYLRESDGGSCRIAARRHDMDDVQPRAHFQSSLAGHLPRGLRGAGEICPEHEITDLHARTEEQEECHVPASSRWYSTRRFAYALVRGSRRARRVALRHPVPIRGSGAPRYFPSRMRRAPAAAVTLARAP